MFLPIIFLLFNLFNFSVEYEIVECDSKIVLEFDGKNESLIFIQSPGFPRSMNANDKENCSLTILSDGIDIDFSLIFVITNGYLKNVEFVADDKIDEITTKFEMYYKNINSSKFVMHFTNTSVTSWNAFQGYILYERTSACPFAADPFTLEDDSQIIYLQSHYIKPELSLKNLSAANCIWKFTGPKGYGFKFVHRNGWWEYKGLITVAATNSSGYDIIKGYGLRENQVYYNNDNFLIINATAEQLFMGYITIVKNQIDFPDEGCKFIKNESVAIWTNIGATAYPINSKCILNFEIPKNTLIITSVIKFKVESFVDYIELFDGNGERKRLENYNATSWSYDKSPAFLSNVVDKDGIFTGVFVSDGSVQNEGFEIHFKTIDCTCASEDIIVPCDDEYEYPAMNQTACHMCPNMFCNFTVKVDNNCSKENMVFTVLEYNSGIGKVFGFKIFVDNTIYMDSNDLGPNFYFVLNVPLMLQKEIKISIYSVMDKAFSLSRPIYFTLEALESFNFLDTIVLSNEKPSAKIDLFALPSNSFFTVELSNETIANNGTLEMFSHTNSDRDCFLLFSDKTLQRVIDTLQNIKLTTILTKTSITIFKSTQCKEEKKKPVIYRIKEEHTKHCLFLQNLKFSSYRPITAIAKPSGYCEVIFIVPYLYVIDEIWTNSENESLKIYSGSEYSNQMLDINITNMHVWKRLLLGAPFYTFVLPPVSSIVLGMSDSFNVIKFDEIPFKSIFETPSFGSKKKYNEDNSFVVTYEISNPVIFQAIIFDISTDAILIIIDKFNNTVRFEKRNQVEMFQNTIIKIYYNEPNDGYMGARISIFTPPDDLDKKRLT